MHLHVYLACVVRCSATGNSLCDASLKVTVDGSPVSVIRRSDGFVVFTKLSAGTHKISFTHPNYHPENRTVEITENDTVMDVVTMRPLRVIGAHLCRLTVTGLLPGSKAYISGMSYPLQLQQSECKEGTRELRLFRKGAFRLIPPLLLLCADAKAPEICILEDRLEEDRWRLYQPLTKAHKRGVKFYPTQPYEADENGAATATFFAAGPVVVSYNGTLYEVTVEEGETTWQIPS